VQAVEIGDTVGPEDDGLAIDHKLPVPILQRALDDPRIAAGPIVTVASE
jgi:hypothetical protein